MANNQTEKTAVIYARVSSTTDRQSTDRQVSDLTAYAGINGYTLACPAYREHISGAKKNEDRVVLNECLQFCIDNKVDVLLVSELSRLGRNVYEVQENVKKCLDAGLNVFFQKEQFQLFTIDGKVNPFTAIFVAVLGTCAQMEREAISFRLQSGRAQYIAKGGRVGRKVGSGEDAKTTMEKYPEVVKHLGRKKNSVREISAMCQVSVNTVQKVKRAMVERGYLVLV